MEKQMYHIFLNTVYMVLIVAVLEIHTICLNKCVFV